MYSSAIATCSATRTSRSLSWAAVLRGCRLRMGPIIFPMLLLATASWNIKEKVRSVSGVGGWVLQSQNPWNPLPVSPPGPFHPNPFSPKKKLCRKPTEVVRMHGMLRVKTCKRTTRHSSLTSVATVVSATNFLPTDEYAASPVDIVFCTRPEPNVWCSSKLGKRIGWHSLLFQWMYRYDDQRGACAHNRGCGCACVLWRWRKKN